MKYTIHVRLADYEYLEWVVEGDPEDALDAYRSVQRQLGANPGLSAKEFNALVDAYLETGKVENGAELWESMSKYQQEFFQEVKRSIKRRNK